MLRAKLLLPLKLQPQLLLPLLSSVCVHLYTVRDQAARLPPTDTFDCLVDNICWSTVAVWAVGGQPFSLPDVAGLPMGPGSYTKFVLQVRASEMLSRWSPRQSVVVVCSVFRISPSAHKSGIHLSFLVAACWR